MPTGCYIANRKSITKDDYGHDIETFQTPEYFNFLLMPSGTNSVDAQRYGEQVDTMYTAYIPKSFIGKFHRGDRAYLIDEDLQDLVQNANIGLMEAVEHFNPKAHIDFDEYVIFWVRDNILKNKEKKND